MENSFNVVVKKADNIADNAVGLRQLKQGTPDTFIGYDSVGDGRIYDIFQFINKDITFGVYNSDGVTPVTTGGKISTLIQSSIDGDILSWSLTADQPTSATIDIWKHSSTIPTNADSITGTAKPNLSSSIKSGSSILTGWTTSILRGDLLMIEVESNTMATNMKLILTINKTVV